jgi:hypothetical protein
MSVEAIIAPSLFDALSEYSKAVARDKDLSPDPPTGFCDNFYVQFFQNRLKQEITGYGKGSKQAAVALRLDLTGKETQEVVLLITAFETYCDVRYDVFSETYGGENGEAVGAFLDYLAVLLQRISAWAALEQLAEIRQRSDASLTELKAALQAISK